MSATTETRLKFVADRNMGQSPTDELGLLDERPESKPFMQGNAEFGPIHPTPRFTCDSPPKSAKEGDTLISVRAPVGALNIANQDVGIGRGLCAITWKEADSKFGWWVLHERRSQLEIVATGSTYKAVSVEDVGNLVIPTPSLLNQERIAHFLDRETSEIDALVAEKERMLALLEEKRAALISRVVTRGLNPNAPTKPSGLDWLGEIPKHWGLERSKRYFIERDERSETGDEEMLTVSHITGVTPRSEKDVNMFEAESNEGYKLVSPDQLVINTLWAWMGAMGVARHEGIVSPAYHVYRIAESLLPAYVDLLVRMPAFKAEVVRFSKGVWSSRLRLYPEGLHQIWIPVPPLAEQEAIIAHIRAHQTRAAALESALRDSIALLKERRAALITAAVTGRINPSIFPA